MRRASYVAIAVFDDRIEIYSIGAFSTGIRAELLTQEHRVQEIVYPSAAGESFSVALTRDVRGNVSAVTDSTDPAMVYWEATADYQGIAMSQECLGNGVCTNTAFEDLTGRVESIESQVGPQAYHPDDLIQDLKYKYYPSGLLEEQTDPSLPVHSLRIYSYDALDRLRTEVVGIGASVNWYEYDHLGNLTLKNDQTLAYDRSDSFQPHAARTMGDNEYQYDDKGNQVLRTGPDVAGGRQQIRYTPFNLPKQVDTGPASSPEVTTFDYDANHVRTTKRTEGATTLFIGGHYERVEPHDTSGERTHKYHVFAGGRRVAQVSRTEDIALGSLEAPEYQFLSRDRLGSVHTITDIDGDVVDPQRTYDPFGQPRDELSSGGSIRAGFTGHEHDPELGLIDMRGRIYDPMLGRFLTPDPLANPLNLQSLNRYSYVLNSPMNLVDPSGFQGGPPPSGPPSGSGSCTGCVYVPSGGPSHGMGGGGQVPEYDNAADVPWFGEAATAPQDLGHADPSESGSGPSQTAPRPAAAGGAETGANAAPQPAAAGGAAAPAPGQSTGPISNPGGASGGGGGPPAQGRGGGGPQAGGGRPSPSNAGGAMALAGGGGQGGMAGGSGQGGQGGMLGSGPDSLGPTGGPAPRPPQFAGWENAPVIHVGLGAHFLAPFASFLTPLTGGLGGGAMAGGIFMDISRGSIGLYNRREARGGLGYAAGVNIEGGWATPDSFEGDGVGGFAEVGSGASGATRIANIMPSSVGPIGAGWSASIGRGFGAAIGGYVSHTGIGAEASIRPLLDSFF